MSRFLLSAASIFALLIAGLTLPQSAEARRCDERMPLTLLSLYRTSDAIYVGRYEKNEDGAITEEAADYRVVAIKKHFSISSALKGEPRKFLTIEDTEYRYKDVDAAGDQDAEHGDAGEYEDLARPGDSVMLFVAKDAETGTLNLTETSDGIKKMTPDKLSAYEARIKDLKGILGAEKPQYSKLVGWMVRTAENPLTRWEGTFELLQSFQNMELEDERARQAKEKPANSEGAENLEEYIPEAPKEFETGDPGFARSMTQAQKVALTNILLTRERSGKAENNEEPSAMAHGDRELIELVKRWGDSRVASNLLEQLRHDGSDTNAKAELMTSISSILHDDDLTALSDEYSNIQWETDEDEVRVEGEVELVVPDQAAPDVEPEFLTDQQAIPIQEKPRSEPESSEAKTKKTYAQLRAELMGKFVSRADQVLAREQNKKTAKLNR